MRLKSRLSLSAGISAICNGLGMLFLFGCFAASVIFNVARSMREDDPDVTTIRFSHFHLHGGLRDSYDIIAREYMRRNPGTRVQQIDVPIGVFPAWLSTQLVSDEAPDIMLISGHFTDDRLACYVEPITAYLEQPNPYNAGTTLENIPWRDTFVDGLYGGGSFVQFQKMQDYLSLPTAVQTIRVYYNQDLFQKITGSTAFPTTFDGYIKLCEEVKNHARTSGQKIVPMAGSRYNAIRLLQVLFSSQTQSLAAELVNDRVEAVDTRLNVALGFLKGSLSLNHPALRDACRLSREFCRHMQDGFMQLNREDATFLFAQKHALMIVSGSWDIATFQTQCQFPVAVAPVPLPALDHPVYGKHLLSKPVESAHGHENFGITSRSRNKKEALDFLRFLTSQPANQILADTSGWVPVIVGVETPKPTEPFLPFLDGQLPGFHFTYNNIGAETTGVFYTYLHKLLEPSGSVDAFIDAAQEEMLEAMEKDVRTHLRDQEKNIARLDTSIAAGRELVAREVENQAWRDKFSNSYRAQNQSESRYYWLRYELQSLEDVGIN